MRPEDQITVGGERPTVDSIVRSERDPRTGMPTADRSDKRPEEPPASPRSEATPSRSPALTPASTTRRSWVPVAALTVGAFVVGGGGWALASRGTDSSSSGASSVSTTRGAGASTSPANASSSGSATATPTTPAPSDGGLLLRIASPCALVPAGAPAGLLGQAIVGTFVLAPGQALPTELAPVPVTSSSHQCRYYAAPNQASGDVGGRSTRISVPRSVQVSVEGRPWQEAEFRDRNAQRSATTGCRAMTAPLVGGIASAARTCTESHDLGLTSSATILSVLYGRTVLTCSVASSPAGDAAAQLDRLIALCSEVRDKMPREG